MLKRANHFVNTPTDIYIRPAGSIEDGDDCAVMRIPLGNHRYITPQAKGKLALYTECVVFPDEDQYNKDVAEEQLIFRTLFKEQKERRSGRPVTEADLTWDPSPVDENDPQVAQAVVPIEHRHNDPRDEPRHDNFDVDKSTMMEGLIAILQHKR